MSRVQPEKGSRCAQRLRTPSGGCWVSGGTTRSLPRQSHVATHPASNTTRARPAWSPSVPAGTPQETRVCSASTATFQLSRLVKKANANPRRELLLLETNRTTRNSEGGLLCAAVQRLGFDGITGLFGSQPGHFTVQSCYDARQPSHPLSRPLT